MTNVCVATGIYADAKGQQMQTSFYTTPAKP